MTTGQGEHAEQSAALAELKERLRTLCTQRHLTMATLPRLAGRGRTTVSQALNGTTVPSESTVVALAAALRVEALPLLRLRARALPAPEPKSVRSTGAVVQQRGESPDPEAEFEDCYRQYVVHRYGELSVIGLDLSRPERSCWPLDAAYLSLEFASRAYGSGGLDTHADDSMALRVERAEQALAGRRRTLVRGLAGGGKTTLLQWLAVSTARRELPPELAHLTDCVPFMLQLRTLARRHELPYPQDYLTAVGYPRANCQPEGWADRVMHEGRALLLVDGLDEVPQLMRAQTQQWLRNLLAAYPQVACVVTTRPWAVREGWLAGCDFTELTVRPMSTRDVAVFVTRWHQAAGRTATEHEQAALAALEEQLKDTVRSQRGLALLSNTPLLCALVCALHRDRRGHLPHSRMELYEAALSMLLHRRDLERDIGAPEGLVLTEHQSIRLLQRLAYWLFRNDRAELDHDTALGLVADALPTMPQIQQQADAKTVLTHLLARSGLLRQPTCDTIDFVHRTFQDYLGARAALEARDIPLLVRNAHETQREDVLRMAVAHGRPDERAALLEQLITRGDDSPQHRTHLHLLATACLEHATELDPVVREEVQRRAAVLLPPRHFDEAKELARVGPVILDLLPGPEGLLDDEAEAVVRTAALVGGDAALTVLKRFRTSTSRPVQGALSLWDNFDPLEYAHEIFGHMPDLPQIRVATAEQLAALRALRRRLDSVSYSGSFTEREIADSVPPERLRRLQVLDNPALRELDPLRSCTALESISIYRCPNVRTLNPLVSDALTAISLDDRGTGLIDDLPLFTGLRTLTVDTDRPYEDLRALPVAADLTYLSLGQALSLSLNSLAGISRWPRIASVMLWNRVEDCSELGELSHLSSLSLLSETCLPPVVRPGPLTLVRKLWLTVRLADVDLALIPETFPELEELTVNCLREHQWIDLVPLLGMPALTRIRLLNAAEVTGADRFPPGTVVRTPRPR
ncbi:NACHT domain-containing protein [Streptomyces sp. NPDC054863]